MNKLVEKYYKFPLTQTSSYIFDSDNNMCAMYCTHGIDKESQKILLEILNGKKDIKFNSSKQLFSIKEGYIFYGEKKFMLIRGWGRLQYIKTDDPATIQDAFGQWIVDTLNNYNK